MTIETFHSRLRCLGWRARERGRQSDARWRVSATSCGLTIIVLAETRQEAWSIVSAAAMKITSGGLIRRLPRAHFPCPCQGPAADAIFVNDNSGNNTLAQLLAEEQQLRKRLKELDAESQQIDQRLIELEWQL